MWNLKAENVQAVFGFTLACALGLFVRRNSGLSRTDQKARSQYKRPRHVTGVSRGRGLRAACDRQDYTSDRTLPRDRTIVSRMCSCVGQMTYGAQ